ncbi:MULTISPECIES: nitroreductase family deazaflavin-dependent oxidoreductase [Streptomyces]|uniref:nitroreductase family deazaflavin-dependent oxidoreductase n=1 Tax=Streptomyces TaxID=1883 RepID=UPI000BC9E441|nr:MULTISPECIES: nitroreductase family deazaflavin-dependent oxidoreductase [Streptomyces]MDX2550655.1 nitroreductase family deazaflavin-dependent oxidoreductase [Streptomyces stelliscabiei]MDX2610353.1 nitroreductase family deazaflavin-dependent oxidoreductase [Streptomyces stelliscabiei]MDX2634726.1 nitroreductase family deazaflavin-dependent oxidoreductase [Streptomyces stelliscabiei]MDX2659672.1 nitroreductase family deazaflavin-dependent oxidoreductase [Streptomyces stelliscabiei]MDX27152
MPLKGDYEPSKAQFVRDQVALYESSGGTQGTTLSVLVTREEDERLRDLPVVILTTLGARSGKIRKTPVMRVEHDGSHAAIASMAGAPTHPVWYRNAVADPRVELQDGPVRRDMLAREVTGDERALWWARAVEAFPDYATYQENTTREIPVLVLEPAAHEH